MGLLGFGFTSDSSCSGTEQLANLARPNIEEEKETDKEG